MQFRNSNVQATGCVSFPVHRRGYRGGPYAAPLAGFADYGETFAFAPATPAIRNRLAINSLIRFSEYIRTTLFL